MNQSVITKLLIVLVLKSALYSDAQIQETSPCGLVVCFGLDYTSNRPLYTSIISAASIFSYKFSKLYSPTEFRVFARFKKRTSFTDLKPPSFSTTSITRWESTISGDTEDEKLIKVIDGRCTAMLGQAQYKTFRK